MNDLKSMRADFADGFGGEIFYAEDAGFDQKRAVWNAMINRRPAVIARCRDARDVQTAVRHAVACDLPISIRGGGHNVAGHAVCDNGVMIDLSLMRRVEVDASKRIANVDGGALWQDVDTATQAHGLATKARIRFANDAAGLPGKG